MSILFLAKCDAGALAEGDLFSSVKISRFLREKRIAQFFVQEPHRIAT